MTARCRLCTRHGARFTHVKGEGCPRCGNVAMLEEIHACGRTKKIAPPSRPKYRATATPRRSHKPGRVVIPYWEATARKAAANGD